MVAVANKVRDRADVDLIERGLDLEVIASVPWDDEFAAAERRGAAPIESAPGCAAVGAVESLCNRLMNGSST